MTRYAIAAKMTEAELEENVRALCKHLGLTVQHIHDARRCWVPGWPDLEILGTRIIHRELKSQHGTLRPEQRRVGSLIVAAGGDWAPWRPADWVNGVIEAQLRGIA